MSNNFNFQAEAGFLSNKAAMLRDTIKLKPVKYLLTVTLIYYLITTFNLLKPTGHVMHQQFNIQQLYVLLTLYLCVLYLSENKQ